ncbi:MAG: DinB family protein [Mycobacteriales bacterium]
MREVAEPAYILDERTMLENWLDYHRATLAWKCEALTPEQLCERSVPPASMSLAGLVRHLAEVERGWFRRTLGGEDAPAIYYSDEPGGDPDGDFNGASPDTVLADIALWRAEIDLARAQAAAHPSLDDTGRKRTGEEVSLRWIYVHMIEEYARHNGHADFLRERIDGAVGD